MLCSSVRGAWCACLFLLVMMPFAAGSAEAVQSDARAADGPPPPLAPAVTPQGQYKDGTYLGWGSCRHGDIQASVVVTEGRIVSAVISQCRTRYSCSWIAGLPSQVIGRQGAQVDYVSGVTESTDAFSDAIAEALSKAK